MRPTDLKFRSPKERTPDGYNPNLTYNGVDTTLPSTSRKQLFSQTRRFDHYDSEFNRTSPRVGPGSYLSSDYKAKTKGRTIIKPLNATGNLASNGFMYVGNTIIYDPLLVNKKQRKQDALLINDSNRSTVSSLKAISSVK